MANAEGSQCPQFAGTPHRMDNWFDAHNFIAGYLHAFQYAIATEGDRGLRDQYYHYITRCVPIGHHCTRPADTLPSSESCKLAQTSRLAGDKRLSKLNLQAAAIHKEFRGYKVRWAIVFTVTPSSDLPHSTFLTQGAETGKLKKEAGCCSCTR